jgi:hypothetical protein
MTSRSSREPKQVARRHPHACINPTTGVRLAMYGRAASIIGPVDPEFERRRLDYERTLETYRQLADIRFKLLAFVPTLSGVAVALLSKTSLGESEEIVLAALGLLVTLGILVYDQRNTQFYNGAITRAQQLEKKLGLEKFGRDQHAGLFGSRKDHPTRRMLGLPVGHDLGLAFVYSPVIGAWAFAVVEATRPSRTWIAPLIGSVIALLAFAQFQWNDGKPVSLRKSGSET